MMEPHLTIPSKVEIFCQNICDGSNPPPLQLSLITLSAVITFVLVGKNLLTQNLCYSEVPNTPHIVLNVMTIRNLSVTYLSVCLSIYLYINVL